MPEGAKRKSGGARKHGHNLEKCKRYALARRRFKSKVKKVRKSCGEKAALAYLRGPVHAGRYVRRKGV